jgi:lipopolysaccharide export system protein LptC
VQSQQGTITSERLEVLKSGEVVRFTGNVIMNLAAQPDDAKAAQKR